MKIPQIDILTSTDDENELIDKLNSLSGSELLELQEFSDKITEFVLIIHLARSEYGTVTGATDD